MPPEYTTACPDWEKRIIAGKSIIPLPPLFPDESELGISVLKELILMDVLGHPTMGEAARPWLMEFASAIFGSYDYESGRRLISEFFLLVSKKNSKSTTAAAIMITSLIRNWRDSAEFLILAPTVEIATNSFYPARDMIKADEELSDLLHIQDHIRTITHRETGATLKVIAADSETVGGKKATGILIDEVHLFGRKPNAENMLREACGGLASRTEGFVIWLSTQSEEAPAGVFRQKLAYARGVRDGKIDDKRFLPVIYEFPSKILKEKKHLDPKMFFVTNPNLGASVDEEFLLREHKKAENDGEQSMCGFLAKHLNVEMVGSMKAKRWAGADFWADAAGEVSLDSLIEQSEVIVVGIDGGGLDDMLGLAVIGRITDTRNWLLWTRAWLHPIALERRKSNAPRYQDFAKDGDLIIVDEVGQDIQQVGEIIEKLDNSGLLDRIAVDAIGIGDIIDELENRELSKADPKDKDNTRIVGVSQGYRLNGAIKTTERRVAGTEDGGKRIIHGGQPMMAWCVGNARVVEKGNAVMIAKSESGIGKIDPLMAVFNATTLLAMNPLGRNFKSIYDGMDETEIKERMAL